jgi:hypothetical protein
MKKETEMIPKEILRKEMETMIKASKGNNSAWTEGYRTATLELLNTVNSYEQEPKPLTPTAYELIKNCPGCGVLDGMMHTVGCSHLEKEYTPPQEEQQEPEQKKVEWKHDRLVFEDGTDRDFAIESVVNNNADGIEDLYGRIAQLEKRLQEDK